MNEQLMPEYKLESTATFDKEEIYTDCTVQILTNTVTGEQSIGWWKNENPPKEVKFGRGE